MALLSALKDSFVAPVLNTGNWTQFTGGSATMSYGNGASTIYPATTSSSTDGDLSSVGTFDMTSSGAFLNVTSVPGTTGANSDASFRIKKATTDYLQIQVENGTIFAQKVVASAQTNIASTTYNPITHAWWQMRESGGTTFWEVSSDGLSWLNLCTPQSNPITVTAMTVLIAGTSFGVDTSPRPFTFRYFNMPVSEGIYNHLRVGDGMSVAGVAN